MKRFILSIFVTLCMLSAVAQQKVRLYLNNNCELTSPQKAVMYRDAVIDFKEMVFGGAYHDYDMKGQRMRGGMYVKGRSPELDRVQVDSFCIDIFKLDFDTTAYRNLNAYFVANPPDSIDLVNRQCTYPEGANRVIYDILPFIQYPKKDRLNKTTGTVFISLTIDAEGFVTEEKVLKAPSETLAAEALRVIRFSYPKLLPAMADGKPYKSVLTLPVTFKLAALEVKK
jgi:TonB family protein